MPFLYFYLRKVLGVLVINVGSQVEAIRDRLYRNSQIFLVDWLLTLALFFLVLTVIYRLFSAIMANNMAYALLTITIIRMPYKCKHLLTSLGQLIGALLLLSQNNKTVAQELFPVQQAGKWGYQTAQGHLVIIPQYELAKRFKDQYAVVANQNHLGVIDKNNRLIIPFQYDFIDYLDKDRFEFGFRDTYFGEYKVGVINVHNQVLIKPIFRSISWRANHYVVQTTRDSLISSGQFRGSRGVIAKYGLYDLAGEVVIPCKYDYLSWLDDSLLVMRLNNQQALYNVMGQALTPFEYRVIGEFHEGLARVVKGGLHGFINKAGKLVIPPRFLLSEPFTNGLAMVMIDNKWGAINHQGGYSIEPKYSFDEVKNMLKKIRN